jgi:hypothetical protein
MGTWQRSPAMAAPDPANPKSRMAANARFVMLFILARRSDAATMAIFPDSSLKSGRSSRQLADRIRWQTDRKRTE